MWVPHGQEARRLEGSRLPQERGSGLHAKATSAEVMVQKEQMTTPQIRGSARL